MEYKQFSIPFMPTWQFPAAVETILLRRGNEVPQEYISKMFDWNGDGEALLNPEIIQRIFQEFELGTRHYNPHLQPMEIDVEFRDGLPNGSDVMLLREVQKDLERRFRSVSLVESYNPRIESFKILSLVGKGERTTEYIDNIRKSILPSVDLSFGFYIIGE